MDRKQEGRGLRDRLSSASGVADPGSAARSERFPAIEGVRALAALAIVVFHVGEVGMTGWLAEYASRLTLGVPVFFVVSAFVLYRPFVASRVRAEPAPPMGMFFLRRVARIVPLYWITLTVVWATCPLFSAQTRTQFFAGVPWWRYYLFAQVYDPASSIGGLGPAWSLNVEVAFYLALPIWAMAAAWVLRRGVPVHLEIVLLGLIVVAGSAVIRELEMSGSYLAKTPPANAGFFAIGMALAIVSVDLASSTRPTFFSRAVRLAVPIAPLAIAVILGVFLFVPVIPYFDVVEFVFLALVLLPAAFSRRTGAMSTRFLMQRHLQLIGVLSYAVYLFHRQVALGLRLWFWAPMDGYNFLVALGAVLALTVLLATVSFRYLEKPLMQMARAVSRPTRSLQGGTASS